MKDWWAGRDEPERERHGLACWARWVLLTATHECVSSAQCSASSASVTCDGWDLRKIKMIVWWAARGLLLQFQKYSTILRESIVDASKRIGDDDLKKWTRQENRNRSTKKMDMNMLTNGRTRTPNEQTKRRNERSQEGRAPVERSDVGHNNSRSNLAQKGHGLH